ncbi:MAG: glycogen/starch/alpha-glucan phosphorylase [Clostridiaceae bacterium]|jgi:starch phosphorylase|nr:glycogen/starch/alpha-glucan phosphorylase [Clostridiaceae bacterium]
MEKLSAKELQKQITTQLAKHFGIKPSEASQTQMYQAVCMVVRDILTERRVEFKNKIRETKAKQVYYMSMEFLLGRSLKNHLFNLSITKEAEQAVKALGADLNDLYPIEPDAGLGNGGLGRLAAAYLDSLTSTGYAASGFSIMYDYGIFKQVLVDGWQTEVPDEWLKLGHCWLSPRMEEVFEVRFGGVVDQSWTDDGKLNVKQRDYMTVLAVPYDMGISGYDTDAVNRLRLWSAKADADFDMEMFSKGQYVKAMEAKAMAEAISKVLYPADNHVEGKSLRLKQQYFFVSASIQSIIKSHFKYNSSLDNLPECVAIHINDTHPTLCIPELMRVLLDEYGYNWEDAWKITTETISYTNHTVMAEALEKWPQDLFRTLLPRIYQIVAEINQRFCRELWARFPGDQGRVSANSILADNQVKMANLCLVTSGRVNGVSALHSDILKNDVFRDYYGMHPEKFTNVTNGITHRRWVAEVNPELAALITDLIGSGWLKKADELEGLLRFRNDKSVLEKLAKVKYDNKIVLADYIKKANGVSVDPTSIFDVQVKRLHEYKRQLLNALHILDLYYRIKENPNLDVVPRTFIFGAKAASAYYMAKQIIRLIYCMGQVINNDPAVRGKIKVVFIENYRVSLAEIIMPAAEISEQISIAGKEASGTGNMKFMINGAATVGTLDGANVEIREAVGDENIFIFGLLADEVAKLYSYGYNPLHHYQSSFAIKRVVDSLRAGIGGVSFDEIADGLLIGNHGHPDPYMNLADFEAYKAIQTKVDAVYRDAVRFNSISLVNIAKAGFFAADRSVREYADRIWRIKPV